MLGHQLLRSALSAPLCRQAIELKFHLFIKEMSVGDLITIQRDSEGDVISWSHLVKSSRSTLWLMAYGDYSVEGVLDGLKRLGCNVEDLKQFRYFSIDVPEDCSLADLDQCLDGLDEENSALAYPSFRH